MNEIKQLSRVEGSDYNKSIKGTFRGDGNILYLDWHCDYTGVMYSAQLLNSKLIMKEFTILFYVNTSIKLVKGRKEGEEGSEGVKEGKTAE